jgi:hypothetical protein
MLQTIPGFYSGLFATIRKTRGVDLVPEALEE